MTTKPFNARTGLSTGPLKEPFVVVDSEGNVTSKDLTVEGNIIINGQSIESYIREVVNGKPTDNTVTLDNSGVVESDCYGVGKVCDWGYSTITTVSDLALDALVVKGDLNVSGDVEIGGNLYVKGKVVTVPGAHHIIEYDNDLSLKENFIYIDKMATLDQEIRELEALKRNLQEDFGK